MWGQFSVSYLVSIQHATTQPSLRGFAIQVLYILLADQMHKCLHFVVLRPDLILCDAFAVCTPLSFYFDFEKKAGGIAGHLQMTYRTRNRKITLCAMAKRGYNLGCKASTISMTDGWLHWLLCGYATHNNIMHSEGKGM